jgi:RNA-directed DNA polymerase
MTKRHKSEIDGNGSACTYGTLDGTLSGLGRVREAARRNSQTRFTSLFHHLTTDLLIRAFKALNRKSAPGVDGEAWALYAEDYVNRIRVLHSQLHRGAYRAQPSKRIYIPKPNGQNRPIGIAALEDKIVQQATAWIFEAIYEEDFHGFSYGSRPGRSPHDALDALYIAITKHKVSWVLDADISGFFDSVIHDWVMKFIDHRIGDPRIHRLVKKWLKAGVSEDGEWSSTTVGTPQGAVISPILANIYLHYVLDLWVEHWRKSQAQGEVYIVRYVDDFVVGFQYKSDAEAFQQALVERMEKFGLNLHEEKTRLLEFGRFAEQNRKERGQGKPETFDFLGFTHYCSRKHSDGKFSLKRKTISKRMRGKLKKLKQELRKRMHHPIPVVGAWLRQVLTGHFQYFGVPGNRMIDRYRTAIARMWIKVLRRRSQKRGGLNWGKMKRRIDRWFPTARYTHPYPNQRFSVNT